MFNVYFIRTIRELNVPESTTAFNPNVPTNDQRYPVAEPVNAGAVYRYIRFPHISLTVVIVMLAGAVGNTAAVLVSLRALFKLFPQAEVNATLALSPFAAAVFNVYFIRTIRELNVPESTTAFNPNVPTNDQRYPVAEPVNAGAVYLYTRFPHTSLTVVIVMLAGAVGTAKTVLVNLSALFRLFPQAEVYATLALSPIAEAVFNVYFIRTIRELKVPESTTAFNPNVPTNDQRYPVAEPVNAGAVYLYTRFPHTSLTVVIVMLAGAVGTANKVLVNLIALFRLLHPTDVN